jgi:hypothetical protein
MLKKLSYIFFTAFVCFAFAWQSNLTRIKISSNHRYFTTGDNKPFFWLGDTGWLLFAKLNREEAEKYLETRRRQGFNVIQVMVLHTLAAKNAYGDSALINKDVAAPKLTPGSAISNEAQYDYWDHVDWIVKRAAEKGIYIAMVPVWGANVKEGHVSPLQAQKYATFLAKRYRAMANVVWMNGGDIHGNDSIKVWKTIGNALRVNDKTHLITFHPFGRTQSSTWFHNEPWLDFNVFQSGHRNYKQDTAKKDHRYGEDNWRYAQADYALKPVKPTFDAEPSYERIPHGLHDTLEKKWTDDDVRRYGYWSVFAGGCGYTYGNNDVMQMHKPEEKTGSYGSKEAWFNSMNDPGAKQMVYLKKLMLSRPYFERVPDQSLIAAEQGERYNRLIGTKGKNYAFIYTYNGRNMQINASKFTSAKLKASWYNPRNGSITAIGIFIKKSVMSFNPPGEQKDGNDWVLILDAV